MNGSRAQPRVLALGVRLASRGALTIASLALVALGGLVSVAVAFSSVGRDATHLATTAAMTIAWSAGLMVAFGCALRAFARDWEDGIIALARSRGIQAKAYIRGRVGGLVIVLAVALGGATLVASLAATAVARAPLEAARDGIAALAYALAFAATMGPLAMAALCTRSRTSGYLALVALLIAPELAAPWTASLLPRGWHELTSIPAALAAVKSGVLSPKADGLRMLRALVGLGAVVAVSLGVVRARLPRVSRLERGDPA